MKIKAYIRLQIAGWSVYWILLLLLNIFYYKNKDYGTFLLILWTILFTTCGIAVFYFLTRFYNQLIDRKINSVYAILLILLLSFAGAYIWGLAEPVISWIINPAIKQVSIAWDINSRGTIPFTFLVAFFSILYYFGKLLEQPTSLQVAQNVKDEEISMNDTIAVYLKNNIVLLPVKNIRKISIDGNYSRIIDNRNIKYELKKPLIKWENDLPKKSFLRIHRSTIINRDYIEKIEPWHNYTFRIRLVNSDIPEEVSRRYAALLKKELDL